MPENSALAYFLRCATGRNIRINSSVATTALLGYLLSLLIALIRGSAAQLLRLRLPRLLFLGSGARIVGMRHASIGAKLRLGECAKIACWSKDGIRIGNEFSLGAFSTITNGFNPFGEIGIVKIGDNVGLGEYCYICAPCDVTIGSNTISGQYLSIHPQNHIFTSIDRPIRLQGTTSVGIVIGEDCWIGAKVTILDGVTIGSGSIIAAGAVVTQSFPERSIIGGVPAKQLGTR